MNDPSDGQTPKGTSTPGRNRWSPAPNRTRPWRSSRLLVVRGDLVGHLAVMVVGIALVCALTLVSVGSGRMCRNGGAWSSPGAIGTGWDLVTTATLIGCGIYVLHLAIGLVRGVARGEIDPEDIEAVSRGWGSVDSDVYDGEWAARDGRVWCDWCHRYHQ